MPGTPRPRRICPVLVLHIITKLLYLLGTLSTKCTPLDMQHQISTTNVLHNKVHTSLCLETRMQAEQEGMSLLVRNQENSLLRARTLNLVILNDKLLLQHFDGVQLLRALGFCKHDLSKVTLSKNSKEVEVVEPYPPACALRVCRWSDLLGRLFGCYHL
jgi:hypothetical protein